MLEFKPQPINRCQRSRLRIALGSLKWKLIERWGLYYRRFAERVRSRQRPAIEKLPTLSWSGNADVDVCMLCGHKQLDMGIAASWSLLRFTPDWRLIVFSDGTLRQEDEKMWRSIVPSLQVWHRHEVGALVEQRVSDYPLLQELWSHNCYSSQLLDAHLVGSSSRLLLMDTDVLCLRYPAELMERLRSDHPQIAWNGGRMNGYCAPKHNLDACLGCPLPDYVNAGLLVTPRFASLHFSVMERILAPISAAMNDPGWMSHALLAQTVYAAMVPLCFPSSSIFSRDYAVCNFFAKNPAVMRHYTSPPGIRARFFTEGIPELLRQGARIR